MTGHKPKSAKGNFVPIMILKLSDCSLVNDFLRDPPLL